MQSAGFSPDDLPLDDAAVEQRLTDAEATRLLMGGELKEILEDVVVEVFKSDLTYGQARSGLLLGDLEALAKLHLHVRREVFAELNKRARTSVRASYRSLREQAALEAADAD